MRLKTIVGYALLLIVTAYSIIVVLGSRLEALQSGIVFFCIISLISTMVLLILKPLPGNRFFIIVELAILCVSLSVFLAGIKVYSVHVNNNIQYENLQNDITFLSQTNQYYADYIDYLNNKTKAYQLSSERFESQITEQKNRLNRSLAVEQNTVPDVIEVPIIIQQYYDDEYYEDEEEYDD